MPVERIPTFACITNEASNYNTGTIRQGAHGLFQINETSWCSTTGKGNGCNLQCSDLTDEDIQDDIICANTIFNEFQSTHQDGFLAWGDDYELNCKDVDLSFFSACNTPDAQVNARIQEVANPKQKVIDRCQLVVALLADPKVTRESINTLVCLASALSGTAPFLTERINQKLIEVSNAYWYQVVGSAEGQNCNRSATFSDGFIAGIVHERLCKDQTEDYVADCSDRTAQPETRVSSQTIFFKADRTLPTVRVPVEVNGEQEIYLNLNLNIEVEPEDTTTPKPSTTTNTPDHAAARQSRPSLWTTSARRRNNQHGFSFMHNPHHDSSSESSQHNPISGDNYRSHRL